MTSFGKRRGGGRRDAARKTAILPALVRRRMSSHPAELVDVSMSGAKVRSPVSLEIDEDLFLKVQDVEVFANVAWIDGDTFGIQFDEQLTALELHLLQHEATQTKLMRLSPEQKLALDEWKSARRN